MGSGLSRDVLLHAFFLPLPLWHTPPWHHDTGKA